MALINIAGAVKINNAFPGADSGSTIQFKLSGWMKRGTDGVIIMPTVETFSLADGSGVITSAALESTRDATPAIRYWWVMVRGTFGGKVVNVELGKIQIRSTPSTQNLYDLLADALITQGPNLTVTVVPIGNMGGSDFVTPTTPILSTFILFNSSAGGVVSPSAYTIDAQGNIHYNTPTQPTDFHVCSYSPAQ